MINNTNIIRSFLDFSDPDTYYFLQIMKRRKDNPNMSKDMIIISDIYIYSMDDFDKRMLDIIKTCDDNNARAYFRLNKRSQKKAGLQMLKKITDMIISEQYKAIKNAYASVSGEFHSDNDKKWIIDLDGYSLEDIETSEKLKELISDVTSWQESANKQPLTTPVPTKNGIHLITRPFNIRLFYEKYPGIDCHKENPTILYCP